MVETQTIIHHCAPPCEETDARVEELKAHYKAQGYKVTLETSSLRILVTARKTLRKGTQ